MLGTTRSSRCSSRSLSRRRCGAARRRLRRTGDHRRLSRVRNMFRPPGGLESAACAEKEKGPVGYVLRLGTAVVTGSGPVPIRVGEGTLGFTCLSNETRTRWQKLSRPRSGRQAALSLWNSVTSSQWRTSPVGFGLRLGTAVVTGSGTLPHPGWGRSAVLHLSERKNAATPEEGGRASIGGQASREVRNLSVSSTNRSFGAVFS